MPTTARYSDGYEWQNHRGQWYVQRRNHPLARADGFVARSKLVMEAMLAEGLVEGESYEDYMLGQPARHLLPEERVWHRDGDVSNDDPENLMLFPSQGALAQHRSAIHKVQKAIDEKNTLENFTRMARENRERRQQAARKAHEVRRQHATNIRGKGRTTKKS